MNSRVHEMMAHEPPPPPRTRLGRPLDAAYNPLCSNFGLPEASRMPRADYAARKFHRPRPNQGRPHPLSFARQQGPGDRGRLNVRCDVRTLARCVLCRGSACAIIAGADRGGSSGCRSARNNRCVGWPWPLWRRFWFARWQRLPIPSHTEPAWIALRGNCGIG